MGFNIFEGNPVFKANDILKARPELSSAALKRKTEVDLVINGGKVKAELLGLAKEIGELSTKLYKHHFDVVIEESQHGITGLGDITVHANYIANSDTPWETLADIDGFIAAAFGASQDSSLIYELKLVDNGNVLLNITTLADGSIKALVIPNMATFELQDSVSAL